MTVQEPIEYLKQHGFIADEVKDMCIEALVQVEQYRTLGTVEELKEAREKQIPKKPSDIDEDTNTFVCPSCGHTLIALDDMTVHQHCLICGKALKWGEEE